MANIDNITVNEFKNLFTRDFPYLPAYVSFKTYFKDDVVFYSENFFKSLKDNNTDLPSVNTSWSAYNDNKDNYISDSDIERAFIEAKALFNHKLIKDEDTCKMLFLYITAHFLVTDVNNASNGFNMGYNGFVSSKSVGSVSESYNVPTWATNNPIFSSLATTGYGRKFLTLYTPYITGGAMLVKGAISL